MIGGFKRVLGHFPLTSITDIGSGPSPEYNYTRACGNLGVYLCRFALYVGLGSDTLGS
jgi:hypothetical protein